ncbi:hypothetical protein PITC_095120 [Penicillium italicum]|uniref:Uncharacterized protein n=1 Tax=Penicillium italicum TaxID=40296 RepID=A0A0A2KYA3_PENIT|nr:hypothetical protein PITC_095120 [Penicillium italicum]
MSNFVHKVKDAMTDDKRDAPGARGNRPPQREHGSFNPRTTESDPNQYNSSSMNQPSGMGSNNPYGSRRSDDEPGAYRDSKGNESHSSSDPDTFGSTGMGGYGSARATSAGSDNVNPGPHDSNLANKMDPRVDSDMDNRAQHSGGATKPQKSGNAPSNTDPRGQSRTQGLDNHQTSEDDFQKSTNEKDFQSRPSDNNNPLGQMTSEQKHETSTEEHKSHSATSHVKPCQTNMQNEPSFGSNATAGSSNTSGSREPSGTQNADPLNKIDPSGTRSNEQTSPADQRSGY